MVTITEHIATFEIDGSEAVKFSRAHGVYGVYGSDIVATLIPDAEEGDQGVYNTSDGGKVTIAHYSDKKELYLKGSGTVIVWCGASPLDDPFGGVGSGGGEKAVITGDFGLLGEVNDEIIVGDITEEATT